MIKLEYNAILGRVLRVDDLETLGVSTQTLAEEAMASGRAEEACALVDYFHQEMRIMHDILVTWLRDIMRYILAHKGVDPEEAGNLAPSLLRTWETYDFGVDLRERCKEAIAEPGSGGGPGRAAEAVELLDHMRLQFKFPHDVLVAWIQDLLTYIASTWGEETVLESILETHRSIWGNATRAGTR